MGPQSRTLLGTHPPGKHCYHDFIQAQRRESYTPLPENESGAQSGFRLPFLVPERVRRGGIGLLGRNPAAASRAPWWPS